MKPLERLAEALQLDASQRRIAFSECPLIVSAAAGSGKTRTLVARYLYLLAQDQASLDGVAAITFSERAANEMKERIRAAIGIVLADSGPVGAITPESLSLLSTAPIGTIHSFCGRILREFTSEAGLPLAFEVMDPVEGQYLLEEAVTRTVFGLHERQDNRILRLLESHEFKIGALLGRVIGTFNAARGQHLDPKECHAAGASAGSPSSAEEEYATLLVEVAQDCAETFRHEKRDAGAVDFDDLLHETGRLLSGNRSIANVVATRFPHILVDEFQDIDRRQFAICHVLRESGSNLFCVGDSKQSIYRFRGSEVGLFHRAPRDLKLESASMQTNYRSASGLVADLNRFFEPLLESDKGGEGPYEAMTPRQGATEAGAFRIYLNTGESTEEVRDREPTQVVEIVRGHLREGHSAGEIAVLFRSAARIGGFAQALQRADIPCRLLSGRGFWEAPEIDDMVAVLKATLDPTDKIAFASVLKSPFASVSDDALFFQMADRSFPPTLAEEESRIRSIEKWIHDVREAASCMTPQHWVDRTLRETSYLASIASDPLAAEKMSNLRKLKDLATRLSKRGHSAVNLPEFLDYLEMFRDRGASESEPVLDVEGEQAVRLMTVHAAKGLEFSVVILADTYYGIPPRPAAIALPDGRISHRLPTTGDGEQSEQPGHDEVADLWKTAEREEEKRVLYVALTRAKERVDFVLSMPTKGVKAGFKLPFTASNENCFAALACRSVGIDREDDEWIGPTAEAIIEKVRTEFKDHGFPASGSLREIKLEPVSAPELPVRSPTDLKRRMTPVPALPVIRVTPTRVGAADAPGGSGEVDSEILGSAAHRLLELWDFRESSRAKALNKIVREFDLNKKQAARLEKMMGAFSTSHLKELIAGADEILKELPMAAMESDSPAPGVEEGRRIVTGRADLVLRQEGCFSVYDYKWANSEEAVSGQESQLAAYVSILAREFGEIREAAFVLLPSIRTAPLNRKDS